MTTADPNAAVLEVSVEEKDVAQMPQQQLQQTVAPPTSDAPKVSDTARCGFPSDAPSAAVADTNLWPSRVSVGVVPVERGRLSTETGLPARRPGARGQPAEDRRAARDVHHVQGVHQGTAGATPAPHTRLT